MVFSFVNNVYFVLIIIFFKIVKNAIIKTVKVILTFFSRIRRNPVEILYFERVRCE